MNSHDDNVMQDFLFENGLSSATIVQSREVYWMKQESSKLTLEVSDVNSASSLAPDASMDASNAALLAITSQSPSTTTTKSSSASRAGFGFWPNKQHPLLTYVAQWGRIILLSTVALALAIYAN